MAKMLLDRMTGRLIGAGAVILVLAYLAGVGLIIYVVAHFVIKFW